VDPIWRRKEQSSVVDPDPAFKVNEDPDPGFGQTKIEEKKIQTEKEKIKVKGKWQTKVAFALIQSVIL
jgi:hypothetical protein